MRKILSSGSFAVLFAAGVAAFGGPAAGDDKIDCNNAANQNDMTACARLHHERADKALNAVYRKLMDAVGEDSQKVKLKNAQRAWITFRDAQCTYESSDMEGGSAEPMLYEGCAAKVTEQRTKELLADLKCKKSVC